MIKRFLVANLVLAAIFASSYFYTLHAKSSEQDNATNRLLHRYGREFTLKDALQMYEMTKKEVYESLDPWGFSWLKMSNKGQKDMIQRMEYQLEDMEELKNYILENDEIEPVAVKSVTKDFLMRNLAESDLLTEPDNNNLERLENQRNMLELVQKFIQIDDAYRYLNTDTEKLHEVSENIEEKINNLISKNASKSDVGIVNKAQGWLHDLKLRLGSVLDSFSQKLNEYDLKRDFEAAGGWDGKHILTREELQDRSSARDFEMPKPSHGLSWGYDSSTSEKSFEETRDFSPFE